MSMPIDSIPPHARGNAGLSMEVTATKRGLPQAALTEVARHSLARSGAAERDLVMLERAVRASGHRMVGRALHGSSSGGLVQSSAGGLLSAAQQLGALSDPTLLLTAIQIHLRDAQTSVRESSAEASEKAAKSAEVKRQELVEQAKRAAEEAGDFLGIGGFLGDIVEAVVKVAAVVASAVVSVVSVGTLAAVAVVGLALMLTADVIATGVAELGLVSKEDAAWIALGIKAAGAVLTTVATCGSAAPATVSEVVTTVTEVCQNVSAIAQAAQGTGQVRSALLTYESELRTIDGERQELIVSDSTAQATADAEAIQEMMELYARLREHIEGIQEAQGEIRRASVRALA